MQNNWLSYFQQTNHRSSSSFLVRALAFVSHKRAALDLGAGALNESAFLIDQGFESVVAVDKERIPEEFLHKIKSDRFQFVCASFDQFLFPKQEFDLINAGFALPFNPPSTFERVWNEIVASLVPGGIFVGQFFGIRDAWYSVRPNMTFHTKEQVDEYLNYFEVLEFREEEKEGFLANGSVKHWHVFHVVAKKK